MAVLAGALEQGQRRPVDLGPLEQGLAMSRRPLEMKRQPQGSRQKRYRKE
jgi:hypothetical protein